MRRASEVVVVGCCLWQLADVDVFNNDDSEIMMYFGISRYKNLIFHC